MRSSAVITARARKAKRRRVLAATSQNQNTLKLTKATSFLIKVVYSRGSCTKGTFHTLKCMHNTCAMRATVGAEKKS